MLACFQDLLTWHSAKQPFLNSTLSQHDKAWTGRFGVLQRMSMHLMARSELFHNSEAKPCPSLHKVCS